MPASTLRQRPRKPSSEPGDPTESDTDAGNCSDTSDRAPAPPTAGHSKGENKASKVKKRLIFGSLLLVLLCIIIAAGHLWTLGLVR